MEHTKCPSIFLPLLLFCRKQGPNSEFLHMSCKLLHEHLNLIFTLRSYEKVYIKTCNVSKAMFNLTITCWRVTLRESLICSYVTRYNSAVLSWREENGVFNIPKICRV